MYVYIYIYIYIGACALDTLPGSEIGQRTRLEKSICRTSAVSSREIESSMYIYIYIYIVIRYSITCVYIYIYIYTYTYTYKQLYRVVLATVIGLGAADVGRHSGGAAARIASASFEATHIRLLLLLRLLIVIILLLLLLLLLLLSLLLILLLSL